jgi:hypothetical protein
MINLKNLFGYKDSNFNEVKILGERYLFDEAFKPEYIMGHAFGADFDAGSYNYKLAKSIVAAREYYGKNLPAIVQSEVGICLERLGQENLYCVGEVYGKGESSVMKSKISTRGIVELSKKEVVNLDLHFDRTLLTGHPYHIQRILDDAEGKGLTGAAFIHSNVEWPKTDSQLWVRYPWLFVLREIVGRFI